MDTVSSQTLRPFVEYLSTIYDDLEEVSLISGIEYPLLHAISSDDVEIDTNNAKRIVDFMLAHKRKTSDVFGSFEDGDVKPRFPNPSLAEMRDKEVKLLRRERNKKGY